MIKDGTDLTTSFCADKYNRFRKSLLVLSVISYYKNLLILLFGLLAAFLLPLNVAAQQTLIIDVNVFGLNTNQTTASEQLDGACTALANDANPAAMDLQNTCQLINSLDQNNPDDISQLQQILNDFSPEEAFSMNDSIVYVSDYQTTNVYARINALRNTPSNNFGSDEAREFSPQSKSTLTDLSPASRLSGGGAAANDPFSRLGVFFSGQVSQGDVDGATFEQDADINSNSFTIGTDYRFGGNVVVGAGLGIIKNETEFAVVAGGTQSDGINVTLFGSWYKEDKGYIDAVLDVGNNSYDLERGIGTDSDVQVLALASTDSSVVTITASAGRNFNMGAWDVGGYARLSATNASVDGYTERASNSGDGSGSIFSIGSQTVKSTKLVIGGEVSRTISTSRAVLIPVIRLEFESESEKNKEDINATLVAAQITQAYRGTDRDISYTNLGIGGSAIFKNGKSAFAYYETHIQHEFVTQNWLKFGLRLEF